jgi:hypothetical protein
MNNPDNKLPAIGQVPVLADADQPDRARRGFLKAAPLGALLVAAAAPAQAEAPVAPQPDPNVKRGYHETDHIRRYYQTAAYW